MINAGLFAQQMLGWRDMLFVTAGVRVDGNSAFGKSFGLQTYPKVSVSYVISDETFWPPKLIETFKLRGAIGESGKAPGAFDATRTWNPIAAEGGLSGFTPGQLGNPNLGPERTRETEVGFDAGLFNGRLGLVFTYFKQRTSDAIINVAYPPSQGFSDQSARERRHAAEQRHRSRAHRQLSSRRAGPTSTARLQYTSCRARRST